MLWGKFKGKEIYALPSRYLRWLAENIDENNPKNAAVCLAADKEYQWREQHGQHFNDDD